MRGRGQGRGHGHHGNPTSYHASSGTQTSPSTGPRHIPFTSQLPPPRIPPSHQDPTYNSYLATPQQPHLLATVTGWATYAHRCRKVAWLADVALAESEIPSLLHTEVDWETQAAHEKEARVKVEAELADIRKRGEAAEKSARDWRALVEQEKRARNDVTGRLLRELADVRAQLKAMKGKAQGLEVQLNLAKSQAPPLPALLGDVQIAPALLKRIEANGWSLPSAVRPTQNDVKIGQLQVDEDEDDDAEPAEEITVLLPQNPPLNSYAPRAKGHGALPLSTTSKRPTAPAWGSDRKSDATQQLPADLKVNLPQGNTQPVNPWTQASASATLNSTAAHNTAPHASTGALAQPAQPAPTAPTASPELQGGRGETPPHGHGQAAPTSATHDTRKPDELKGPVAAERQPLTPSARPVKLAFAALAATKSTETNGSNERRTNKTSEPKEKKVVVFADNPAQQHPAQSSARSSAKPTFAALVKSTTPAPKPAQSNVPSKPQQRSETQCTATTPAGPTASERREPSQSDTGKSKDVASTTKAASKGTTNNQSPTDEGSDGHLKPPMNEVHGAKKKSSRGGRSSNKFKKRNGPPQGRRDV